MEKNLQSFSLIILDIMMDGIVGMEFAARLRMSPVTSQIPIIFCTAKNIEDDMVRGLDVGGDDFITKPYSARNLLAP